MGKYNSDAIDECCEEMLGHTNWAYRNTVQVKEMVKYKKDDAIFCSVLFFREPLKEEEE